MECHDVGKRGFYQCNPENQDCQCRQLIGIKEICSRKCSTQVGNNSGRRQVLASNMAF